MLTFRIDKQGDRTMKKKDTKLESKIKSDVAIVRHLLKRRQEHIEAVAEIQDALKTINKYTGVEIPELSL